MQNKSNNIHFIFSEWIEEKTAGFPLEWAEMLKQRGGEEIKVISSSVLCQFVGKSGPEPRRHLAKC